MEIKVNISKKSLLDALINRYNKNEIVLFLNTIISRFQDLKDKDSVTIDKIKELNILMK